MSESDSLI